jgi:hypothetical protein
MTATNPKGSWPFAPSDAPEPTAEEIKAQHLAEQQKLIEVLKFTPRTYKISMWGYGGERVMGTVDKKIWDYCNDNQVDLSEIAWGDEDTVEDMGLDLDMMPFPPGSWYECDDMGHTNGVSRDAGTLQIEDENGNTIFEKSLDDCDGSSEDSPVWNCIDEVWAGSKPEGTVVFIGVSNEKGTFFEADLELRAPFDITKLELCYEEFDGEEIVTGVTYDGEDIDNWGGSTDGKSSDMNMVLITDDEGNWERYSPEEKDWGHPPIGTSPSDWEKSSKFKFAKVKPTVEGWYSAVWKNYGTTYGTAYWNGTEFGDWEHGQFKPITGVDTWSGYNWDTSSWVNQPPEPVDVICDNKECGWVGKGSDRITDDDYNDHCPSCEGTEFSWIDYDPDTKEGRANRKKYCKEWDPAVSMDRIIQAFPATELDKNV